MDHSHSPPLANVPAERLDLVDALRGFALAAIILLHFIEHFAYDVYPVEANTWIDQLNIFVGDSFYLIFAGKAYAIFALLFGFSYWIQSARKAESKEPYAGRFAWRMSILLAFGFLDGLFFIGGDILALYALLGLCLIPLRKMKSSWLLGISLFFLCQPMELFLILQGFFDPEPSSLGHLSTPYYKTLQQSTGSGNWGTFFWENVKLSQLASLSWCFEFGRMTQTLGLFILGFLFGRHGLFLFTEKTQSFWGKCFIFSLISSWALWVVHECTELLTTSTQLISSSTLAFHLWLNFSIIGMITSLFILLYQIPAIHRCCDSLRIYGRMSLSNYISQSIIGALIFYPVGLGLAESWGKASSLCLGIFALYVQILFCRWWGKNHAKGPLENLWTKLTWVKF